MDRETNATVISRGDKSWGRRSSDATPIVKPMLALIDEHPLRQASLATLLAEEAQDFTVQSFPNETALFKHSDTSKRRIDIVVLSVGADLMYAESFQRCIGRLKSELPDASLVIVCDSDDSALAERALQLGARGYIPTTLAPPVAIAALMLVNAGGTFVPFVSGEGEQAASPTPRVSNDPDCAVGCADKDCDCTELTPRQQQVVGLLKRGKSNKLIAYELGVQESTVKVHVREIMKKLHATNRTHAAYLVS